MREQNKDMNKRNSLGSDILVYLKSPRNVCRSLAISWGFKSAADADAVWDRYLLFDYREIISRFVSPLDFFSKKHLYLIGHQLKVKLPWAKTRGLNSEVVSSRLDWMMGQTTNPTNR
ncbi:hypothetical protein ACSBR2_012891 [Camellia fascicularis]